MSVCRITGGEHDWTEGGPRDFGRYHCRGCQTCLYVPALIQDERTARQRVATLEAELAALRSVAGAAQAFMRAIPCETRDHNISAEGVWLSRDEIDCDECHAVEMMREALAAVLALRAADDERHSQ